MLGQFFTSVFVEEPDGDIPLLDTKNLETAMDTKGITSGYVQEVLDKLDGNKSMGPDCMHPRFLKELSGYLSTPLAAIFQKSLDDKELPLDWKQARISAIYKKGNRSLAGNYRPVSLTSIACKCMERIIRDWIVTHMTENKLFSNKQYGFIKHRSTVLQLLKVLDIWTDAIDRGDTIDTI